MERSRQQSNYDKYPVVVVPTDEQNGWEGWNDITNEIIKRCSALNKKKMIVAVELYIGVFEEEICTALIKNLKPSYLFSAADAMKSSVEIDQMVYPDVTDDRVFGYLTRLPIQNFFDPQKLIALQKQINETEDGIIVIYGTGAALLTETKRFALVSALSNFKKENHTHY